MRRPSTRRAFLGAAAALPVWAALGERAHATEPDDALLADLSRARAKLRTLVVPFTQERTIGLLAATVTSRGELSVVCPDRLRWELFAPDAATYWALPEGLAYETPSGRGRIGPSAAGPFGAVLGDLLSLLGGDVAALRARYQIEAKRGAASCLVVARPRAPEVQRLVRRLELEVAADLVSPVRVVLEETERDRSIVRFGEPRRDAPIAPERMRPSGA